MYTPLEHDRVHAYPNVNVYVHLRGLCRADVNFAQGSDNEISEEVVEENVAHTLMLAAGVCMHVCLFVCLFVCVCVYSFLCLLAVFFQPGVCRYIRVLVYLLPCVAVYVHEYSHVCLFVGLFVVMCGQVCVV